MPDQRTTVAPAGTPPLLAALLELCDRVAAGLVDVPAIVAEGGVVVEQDGLRCTLVVEVCEDVVELSPREWQIAELVAAGATTKAIASALEISAWTVSTYVRRMFLKAGAGSRAELVAKLYGSPRPAKR